MSRYTTQVRWICEMNSGYSVDDLEALTYTPDQIIKASHSNIFDFSYPIYEEDHREELECKILKHYYTREIGAETVALWKLWLNDKLNLIMPKYNKLYKFEKETAEKLLYNIDVYTEEDKTTDSDTTGSFSSNDTGSSNSVTDSTERNAYSDTPQGSISMVDDLSYLTDYRNITDDATTDTTTENESSGTSASNTDVAEDRNVHEYGYRGGKAYYEIMDEYKDKVVNIDELIINDLSDLFMNIW